MIFCYVRFLKVIPKPTVYLTTYSILKDIMKMMMMMMMMMTTKL